MRRTLAIVAAVAVSLALPATAKASGISSKPAAITLRATMPSYAGIRISSSIAGLSNAARLQISSHCDGGPTKASIRVIRTVMAYGTNTLNLSDSSEVSVLQSGAKQAWDFNSSGRTSTDPTLFLNIRVEVSP